MPGNTAAARRARALEARMARALDQLLQDHAEWRRLKEARPPAAEAMANGVTKTPPRKKAARTKPVEKPQPAPAAELKKATRKARPKKAARKAAVKRKRRPSSASPQMLKNLKAAQRKLEALGIKPYAPKKVKTEKKA